MKQLDQKVALITGAAGGIGQGIAVAFAEAGAHLLLTGRNEQALNELAGRLRAGGTPVTVCLADVTNEAEVARLFEVCRATYGRLDLLINNAGVFDGGPLDELSLETWDKVIAVNLRGPFLCTREAMRIMKPQGQGRIINVGSISAHRVRMNSAPYSTSKHGLWGLTQCTALEGRDHGISCGVVQPGNTETPTLATGRQGSSEPVMPIEDWVQTIVAMAALPAHVNLLEATVLPVTQAFLGRG